MDDALITGEPTVFATNSMEIAVPRAIPLASTRSPHLPTLTSMWSCAPQVPCGAATVAIEENTGSRCRR